MSRRVHTGREAHIETAVVPEVNIEVAGEDHTMKTETQKTVTNDSEISALPRQRPTGITITTVNIRNIVTVTEACTICF